MYLNKRKRLSFYIAAVLVTGVTVVCCMNTASPAAVKILNAKTLSDLKPYPELKVFPELLRAIRCNPENDNNFEALFHYNALRDGGVAAYMYRDSFVFFFCKHPNILYDRYNRTGDMRILRFCDDVLSGYDPSAFSEEEYSFEEKQKAIKTLIKKLHNSQNTDREKQFIQSLKKYDMSKKNDAYTMPSRF